MAAFVQCVSRIDSPYPHERILAIGGVTSAGRWRRSAVDAIRDIQANPRQLRPSKWSRPNSSFICWCPCSTRHLCFHNRTACKGDASAGRVDSAYRTWPSARVSTSNHSGSACSHEPFFHS